ncbi:MULTISPECIES: M66 family metalloprotease [Thermus]|uniref:M66 family metalloprotease n=1 Tax=Thermus TaxID=270 RepID=UPI001F326582|nr:MULTISPECIES: M66 family metalloprotease [Thermus]
MAQFALLLALGLAVSLVSCQQQAQNQPPSFTLSDPNPASLTIPQGGSGTTQVTLTPTNGFTGAVSLSLVDRNTHNPVPGITLTPPSVSLAGSPVTQTLTVSVGSGVAPGTYPLKLRAVSGNITQEKNLDVTVSSPPSEDFTLTLESSALSVPQGGTAYVRLVVSGTYPGSIDLSLVDANKNPFSGVTLSPTSTPVPSAPNLELKASPSLSPGTYNLYVRGTGGSLTREVSLTLSVTPASANANLFIEKAEWGQTVLKENLRLVAGKPALLRVHLVASPSSVSLTTPIGGAVYVNNTFQGNLAFSCPNPIPTRATQGDLSSTCNATLPASWVAPGLRVELRVDPANQVPETNESDNLRVLTPAVGAGTTLYLTVVPVVHQGQTASVPDFPETLWRVWPLKDISFTIRTPYTFSGTLSASNGNTWAQLLVELRILRQTDGSGRYYYGFVRVTYTSGIAGIGYIGYPVAVGWDYASSAPVVMAHELGHNFGREHAPCGTSGDPNYPYPGGKIGTWGYDLATGTLRDPNERYDLMSYCGPQWVSDYTYEGAQGFLEATPPRPQSLPEEGLFFTGRIENGALVFNPPLLLKANPEGEPSPYRLRVDGLELPVYVLRDSEGTLHFQAKAPVARYTRVGLYLEGNLLGELVASLLPQAEPRVEAQEEGGFLWVRVQGAKSFAVFHVADDGTRTALTLFHPAGEARLALEGLPPGGHFEVQFTDGLSVRVVRLPR